jgi:hypothetical protein
VPEFATVRRIITAQVQDGSHKVIIDERVKPAVSDGKNLDAGHQLWRIWGTDDIPHLPTDGSDEYADTMFAPPGGSGNFSRTRYGPRPTGHELCQHRAW